MTKLEELRAKRIEQDKQEAIAAATAQETQLIADEEAVASLRKPGMRTVDLGRRVALISKPSHLEFERFMDSPLNIQDHLQFLRSCVVYPALQEVYEVYPAYIPKLSEAATDMLGIERKAILAK